MLPRPAVNDMGDGKTLEWWEEWAPRQQSSDGRPAPHGKSLAIEALRMLPTPRATDGDKGGPGQVNGRGVPDSLPAIARLLPTPTAQAAKHGETPDTTANAFGKNLWDLPTLLSGESTAPLLPDGQTSSDDQRQRQPSQDLRDDPDSLPLLWSG